MELQRTKLPNITASVIVLNDPHQDDHKIVIAKSWDDRDEVVRKFASHCFYETIVLSYKDMSDDMLNSVKVKSGSRLDRSLYNAFQQIGWAE